MVLKFILNILLLIKINSDLNCSYFSDCFQCTSCNNDFLLNNKISCSCKYENNACKQTETSTFISNPINDTDIFNKCTDDNSKNTQTIYCGFDSIISLKSKNYNVSPKNINGYYGFKNLFCNHIFNLDSSSNGKCEISVKSQYIQYIEIFFDILHINGNNEFFQITTENYNRKMYNVKQVSIKIFFLKNFDENPYVIEIKNKENKQSKVKFIIILICVLAVIVIISKLISYFRNKKKSNNDEIEHQRQETERNLPSETENQGQLDISIYVENINYLFEKILTPIIYQKDKINNNNTQCTICISNFINNRSKICITPCNHSFHYKCLSKWLIKNINNPKCPNCNYDFSQHFIKNEFSIDNSSINDNESGDGNLGVEDAFSESNGNNHQQNNEINININRNNNINTTQLNAQNNENENVNNIRIYRRRLNLNS